MARPKIASFHRWVGLVLVAPLVVWSVTGLLFHLKPGWGRAYDMLDPVEPLPATAVAHLHPIEDVLRVAPSAKTIELFGTELGPLYRVTTADGERLVDATTGGALSPLSEAAAETLAKDAVARSTFRADYGAYERTTSDPTNVHVIYANATVDVDRAGGRVSQRGADTDRIDWLYRMHYLQWTGNKPVDRVLAIVGLALIWLAAGAGLVLFFRKRYRQDAAA